VSALVIIALLIVITFVFVLLFYYGFHKVCLLSPFFFFGLYSH